VECQDGVTLAMFFSSSRGRHTRFSRDWSSGVCSSDLGGDAMFADPAAVGEHGVTAVREHGVTAVGEHGVAVANTAFRCGATVRIRYLAVHVTTHRRRAAEIGRAHV